MRRASAISTLLAASAIAGGDGEPAVSPHVEGARAASIAGPVEAPKKPRLTPAEGALDARFRQIFDDVLLPNGLVLDRRSNRDLVSCAATGFTAFSLAIMARHGTADRAEIEQVLRNGFHTTLAANPQRNRGWLYHFTDGAGNAQPWSEVSTVDSAIFYLGFLRAAETLGDDDLLAEVHAAIDAVDRDWLLRDSYFLHGLRWAGDRPVFIPYLWDDSSEGVMIYRLFGLPFTPRVVRHDYPLFAYFYPLCFFNDPDLAVRLHEAVKYQMSHYGYTGVTASDGPLGYTADDPHLISPLALFALSGLFPEARATLAEYGVDAMVPAYHISSGWTAPDRVTIDYASAYILLVRPTSISIPVGE